ncbi:hypothetical protein B9Z33_08505 [Limnohabitans sp. T6-20]|nr:hypothetical protein B9Z33_08505 [Limnohabitans sp. T6-20]
MASNVSYGNVGGVMGAVNAATVNTVNYRNTPTGTSITLQVENYSQVYGTSYSGTIANGWLSNSSNVTVSSVTGSTSGFGIVGGTPTTADVLSSLRFAGNLGGNSNLVQSLTNLSVLGAITSSYGTVNVTPVSGKNTYTITPKALTITGSTALSVYDGVRSYADVSAAGTSYVGLVSSIGGVLTGDSVTSLTRVITTAADTATPISGSAVVGSYVDTLSSAVGSGLSNYTITYAPGAFTVTPAALTITGGNRTTTYNATLQNNATYSVGGLLGTDSVSSVTGVASAMNAGTYNDSLSGALGTGLSNYTINYVNGALTINKAALNIASVAASSVYTASAQTGTYTVTGLQGTVDAVTGVTGLASGTNAGTYTSTLGGATGTGLDNYNITYTNTAPFTITKANATLVGVLNNTAVYSGSAQTNTGAVFTGLLGDDATTISATGYAQATNVAQGTVTDNLSATGVDSGNYNFTVTNGSLRITPKALSVVGAQTTSVYNANTQTNTYTTTGLVGTDAIAVTGSASARNVSTTNDALGVAFTSGAASNYTTTITDGFLKITPATITLSGITAADKVYDSNTTASLSLGSVTTGGVLSTDSVTVNTGTLTGAFSDKNVGSQTVVISGISLSGPDAANYQLSGGTTATTTAAITPKTLNVTGTSLTTTYNGGVQSLAAPVVTGLVTGDNVTIGGNASGTNAGAYNATYTAGGTDAGNYNLVSTAPATLTINKAALVVTANNSGKIVTQADPTLTAQLSGLQGSDTASGLGYTYTTSRASGENAGSYAITPTGAASLTNYTVSYVPGQFTITPAGTVLIKMNPTTSTYGTVVGGTIASVEYVASSGGSLRTLTLKAGTTNVYTDGITGGGEITITPTTSVTSTTNAGTYVGAISNSNSDVSQSNGNFTGVQTIVNTAVVNQASLTLALAPVTKTYDGTAFAAVTGSSVSVTPTGLMNGQTLAGLGGLTYSGAAIGAISASSTPYSLVGSVGSGFANYNVTIAPSTVTINKAPLQITGGTNTYTFDNTSRTNTYSVTSGQLFASDSITGLTGRATRLHAGATADTLSAATGTGLSNYDISYVNGGLTINPAQLLAVATPTRTPAYNGSTAVPNTTVLSGVIAGTSVSGTTSLALSGADVGTQTIINNGTLLSGPNAGDYVVLSSNLANTVTNQVTPNLVSSGNGGGTVVITPAPLTITGGNASYVFNNTTRSNTYSVTSGTLYGSDSVTGVTGLGSGLRANTSANPVYADNLSAASGSGLSNYAITYVNGGLTITPAPLTALATPVATTYSGGTSVANITALSGVIAGTTVSGTTSLVMGSPNAGTQTITNNGTTLSGDFASDYYVVSSNLVGTTPNRVSPSLVATGNGGGTIVVAKAPLTITGATTEAVYNGTQQTNTATVTGAVNGEVITTSGSAVATNVSQGKVNDQLVAVAGSGVDLNNYAVTTLQGSLTITPATLTVSGITANTKQYDGTDAATLSVSTVSYNGVVQADIPNVSVNTASLQGLFSDANAGSNKDVLVSGISITGPASSNYQLSGGNSLVVAGTITPAPLTITGGHASHVFNNTTRTNTYSVSGTLYGTDSVTGVAGLGTGVHAGTHADNLSAADGYGISNYNVTYVNGALTISRAQLTALATPLATTYTGGTTVANTTALSGVIAGTDVSGITSLVLGSPNAGLRNIINNGTTLSGLNGGDYEVVSSNLVGTTPNQVTPTLVSSGNGGGTIMVAKAPLSIAGATSQAAYTGSAQTNTATVTGAVNGEVITTSGNAVARNVGDVVADSLLAVAGSGVDLNNYAIAIMPGSLEITPASFVAAPAAPSAPAAALVIEKPADVFILPPTPPVFSAPLDRISDVLANVNGIRLSPADEPAAQPGACSADSAVLFGADSDMLTDEAKEKLRQCCAANQAITLSGLRGAEGAGQYNIDLGKRRAQAVRKFMENACQMPQAGHPGKPQ